MLLCQMDNCNSAVAAETYEAFQTIRQETDTFFLFRFFLVFSSTVKCA